MSSALLTAPLPLAAGAFQPALSAFLRQEMSREQRIQSIETALRGPAGAMIRQAMGDMIVQVMPVQRLVPDKYAQWRTMIQDCMLFVVLHLSAERLAPKLLEQLELPANTTAEERLFRIIARVPGLQKLGQVLARNRHLHPRLRRALSRLENGISDVTAEQIRAMIFAALGPKLEDCRVKVAARIFSEASVSAVMRFTWWNPELGRRERGVFKVLKPHIPACFAEDMELLHQLALDLGRRHRKYGVAARGISDTFTQVRQLLQREVQFTAEQATLKEAYGLYGSIPGASVPRVIEPLCTESITAITELSGKKITEAVRGMSRRQRRRVAEQLIETLIALPLFAPQGTTMFHADPHAGNLLYDAKAQHLAVLDWALTEFLTLEQRRHLALLFLMMVLRDPVGVTSEILALRRPPRHRQQAMVVRKCVTRFFDQLPVTRVPGSVEAMSLLERVAFDGVRFPAPLVMLCKVMFTLDGILHDIAGPDVSVELVLARHLVRTWTSNLKSLGAPLAPRDWLRVQCSGLAYGGRLWVRWMEGKLESWAA